MRKTAKNMPNDTHKPSLALVTYPAIVKRQSIMP
jgi:hypothetical protein